MYCIVWWFARIRNRQYRQLRRLCGEMLIHSVFTPPNLYSALATAYSSAAAPSLVHALLLQCRYIPGTSCLLYIWTRTGRGDGRMNGGTKGKCSYGKHSRQRNAMPSYWVLQAQDTHASNQNTLGENSERKQSKPKLMFSRNFFNGLALRFG